MADKRIYELSTQATPTASDYLALDKSGNSAAVKTLVSGFLLSSTATTKGDIYAATASATVTRLGVGSNDQVLTADSGEATGLKWGTPAAYLLRDGSVALTANWDVGAYEITANGFNLADSELITLGTGSDYTISYDGTNVENSITSGNFRVTGAGTPDIQLDNAAGINIKAAGDSLYKRIVYVDGSDNIILGAQAVSWGAFTYVRAGTQLQFDVNGSSGSATNAGRISSDGYWSIGHVASATAYADIAASTTSAASIRLRSGTAPTSPNAGDLWFDGTNLKFYDGVATRTLSWT
jgi:hypothetical protein